MGDKNAAGEYLHNKDTSGIDFGTPGNMQQRLLQGEAADVAIAIAATLPDLEKAGKIASGTRMEFASSYVGVVVRAGAPKLDVSTPDGVKRALLTAKTVALSDPKAGTQLGATFIGVADRLGFGADVRSRAKMILGPGSDVAEAVARGEADLGVTLISEILPVTGIALGGELPSNIMPPTVIHAFWCREQRMPRPRRLSSTSSALRQPPK
jgi:molybdate transport system substrate-binding protein